MRKWLFFLILFIPASLPADGQQGVQTIKIYDSIEDLERRISRLSQNFLPWAGGDELFFRDIKNERIGIGTTSPGQTLDVRGAIVTNALATNQTLANALFLGGGNSTIQGAHYIAQGPDATTTGGHAWWTAESDSGGGTIKLVLLGGGNVGVGTSSPGKKLDVNGTITASVIEATNTIQAGTQFYAPNGSAGTPGYAWPGDGKNEGFYWNNNTIQFSASGVQQMEVGNGGIVYYNNLQFSPGGSLNIGDATFYIGDLSYKTLTDRGCYGFFDKGVELMDGRVVSDVEALLSIKKHPIKKTIYGVPMLDYKTFPRAAYKPADKNGVILPRDKDDEPYWISPDGKQLPAADGVETTAVISVMIGAIKELAMENKDLKDRLKALEKGR